MPKVEESEESNSDDSDSEDSVEKMPTTSKRAAARNATQKTKRKMVRP